MHRKARQTSSDAGFTLIEIVVALVVASVLLCIAVPAFGGLLARNRLATAQLELVASLQHARHLAITSGRRTLLCPSTDGQQCSDDTHWERGWVIGSYRSDKASQLEGAPARVTGSANGVVITSTAGRTRIRFQPHGAAGGGNVTFTLCGQGRPDGALAVKVSNMGRVAAAKADADQAATCAAGG